jgi:hypothetical protein
LLARTRQEWRLRRLLEEAEALHRSSAARLRALGRKDLAQRAEQFAAWIRFDLNEPRAARRLYTVTTDLREVSRLGSLFAKVLEGALTLSGADRGNVQILNPVTGSLRIVARSGLGADFLDYFAMVDDEGRRAAGRQRNARRPSSLTSTSMQGSRPTGTSRPLPLSVRSDQRRSSSGRATCLAWSPPTIRAPTVRRRTTLRS